MSSNPRKERRIQWWKENKKQVEPGSADDGDLKVKSKRFKKIHRERKAPIKKIPTKIQPDSKTVDKDEENENEKKNRYLIFVGNLPFNVTKDDVMQHFRCTGNIVDFRLMTKKNTGGSKGCGFLELDNVAGFKKALNLHHSTLGGRKINVEVTCGGGGSGEKRTEKLNEKKKKFKKKRAKKHKPEGTTNDSVDKKNSKEKSDVLAKSDKVTTEKKTENQNEKKNKKRKVEFTEDEVSAKKKALKESGAITAIVKELQLEELVEDKKAEHLDSKSSSKSEKEGKKKKKKKLKMMEENH